MTAKWLVTLVLVSVFAPQCFCRADTPPQSPTSGAPGQVGSRDDAQLRARIEQLERSLREIRADLRRQSEALEAARRQLRQRARQEQIKKVRREINKELDKGGHLPAVRSSLDVQLYGYIKLDAAADTSRTNIGDFARWVENEHGRDNDHQFNVTARQTRLGLKIQGPRTDEIKTSGRIEVDFYGGGYGGGIENRPELRMRHAYMQIDWPKQRFSILAGQTWDVISPLFPSTLNFPVAWWAGNIGHRRPQVRLTKCVRLGPKTDLKLEGAVTRTIGEASGFDPGDTGEDADFPTLQARTSVTFPLLEAGPTTIGVSAHWGQEEYDTDALDHHQMLDTWSANIDFVQPIAPWMTVKGEVFTGENLDAYLGGIGQGVNAATLSEIRSWGGWAAATLGPWGKLHFNVGGSIECVNRGDVANGARVSNSSVFGNVIYKINEHTSVGLEVSRWQTAYKRLASGDSLRVQGSFIYKW